jgi:nitrite reductase (NADH) small subunit/3-phenylpropionate/trans-cinnamate dioxygenase ferredoxin subunit
VEPLRIPLSSLDRDGRAVVEVDGAEIAVFVVEGEAHAFANACPHEGNPLHEGDILGDTLTCAYHGWKFDLGTGACLVGEEPARVYRARIEGGAVVVTS